MDSQHLSHTYKVSHWLKKADRFVGIPLVWLLGWFTPREKPHTGKHIALLKTSGIGDTVILSAVIADIHTHMPQAKLTLFVSHTNSEMAQLLHTLYPRLAVLELPIHRPWQAISMIRQHRFDLWLDFGPWPRINAVFSYAAKACAKVGFMTQGQYRHYVYHRVVIHQHNRHELENYRAIAKHTGLEHFTHTPDLSALLPAPTGQNPHHIVLHLCSGGSKQALKMLPIKTAITLINQLTQAGKQVRLTGNKSESHYLQHLQQHCLLPEQVQVDAGNKTLQQSIALLRDASCVVAVDTGIMHLAAALQCKVLAIHGPTDPLRWGGIGSQLHTLYAEIHCAPCLQLGFESNCDNNQCIQAFEASHIMQKLQALGWL